MAKLTVLDTKVSYYSRKDDDYINLSDMARYRDAERVDYIIQNWMRNRNTIDFLGLWEQLNNHSFNSIEFDGFRNQAGLNSFALTPKLWIERTNAVGIIYPHVALVRSNKRDRKPPVATASLPDSVRFSGWRPG